MVWADVRERPPKQAVQQFLGDVTNVVGVIDHLFGVQGTQMRPRDAGIDSGGRPIADVALGFLQRSTDSFFDFIDVFDPALLHPLGGHNSGAQHLEFSFGPDPGHDGGNFIGADVDRCIKRVSCQPVTFLNDAV